MISEINMLLYNLNKGKKYLILIGEKPQNKNFCRTKPLVNKNLLRMRYMPIKMRNAVQGYRPFNVKFLFYCLIKTNYKINGLFYLI